MKNLANKIVVITGAGSGIGRALAIEYGKLGAWLALNDFDEHGLNETVEILKSMGVNHVISSVFSVSDKNAMANFATHVKTHWRNANIVINNAGIAGDNLPAYLLSEESYRRIMEINFFGVLNGCQSFLPQLVENNEGAIVNVSSIFGLLGIPNNSDYCASKFAVRGYTEALAAEFQQSPITVHCVHPGGINTNITKNIDLDMPGYKERFLTTKPEDIAKYIIKSVQKNRPKIIYGKDSFRARIYSNFIPQKLLTWFTWTEAKTVLNLEPYKKFIKSL